MRTKSFKDIENEQARKKARKSYYKVRRGQKKHRSLIKDKERHERNKKRLILVKEQLKKIKKSLKEKSPNLSDLEKLFRQVQKSLDEAAQKKIIHKNKAANKKRKTRKKINELIKQKGLSGSV